MTANGALKNCTGTAESLGLTLYLDRQIHQRADGYHARGANFGTFRIGIQDQLNSFGMGVRSTNARIGYKTDILVSPKKLAAQEELKAIGSFSTGL
jgi:hypothetical protein